MQRYTQDDLETAFASIAPPAPLGPRAQVIPFTRSSHLNAAAQANLPDSHWFDRLSRDEKNALLTAILTLPAIKALADAERPGWLGIVFALADAERQGADQAHALALAWSRTSGRFISEADFDKDWRSFQPGRTTVGTLLAKAKKHGFDLAPWRARADAAPVAPTVVTGALGTAGSAPPAVETTAPSVPKRGAPFSSLPYVMSPQATMGELNRRIAKVNDWGGPPACVRFNPDGSLSRLKLEELRTLLAGHMTEWPNAKGETQRMPAHEFWLRSKEKLEFDRIFYDPEGKKQNNFGKILNLWTGFSVNKSTDRCDLICMHIFFMCNGNRKYFQYFLRWLAHCVQHPGTTPGTMVVLRSDLEGVGKSTIGQIMLRIFGQHGVEVASATQVFGEFNEILADKSFVLLEETGFAGDHHYAARLKATTTAPTLVINPKGLPAYTIPNVAHFMLCTNEAWAVPAGAGARRFLVLDIRERKPRAYFDALWHQIDNGGVEGFLLVLLQVNLTGWNPRDVPRTSALIDQQRRTADDVVLWALDSLPSGVLVPTLTNGGFMQPVPSAKLHASYLIWAQSHGIRHPKSHVGFGKLLSKFGLPRAKGAGGEAMWIIPSPTDLMAAADRAAGIEKP